MYDYQGELIRVVDGDTIDVYVQLGFDVRIKQRVRLLGINTPESRTRNLSEKSLGLTAKKISEDYLGKHPLLIRTYKSGKYGRYLAYIHPIVNSAVKPSVNDILLSLGFARPYFGKGKVSWY